jgi:hypothetical protein
LLLLFVIIINIFIIIKILFATYFNLVKESKKLSPEAEEILKQAILKIQKELLTNA